MLFCPGSHEALPPAGKLQYLLRRQLAELSGKYTCCREALEFSTMFFVCLVQWAVPVACMGRGYVGEL